MENRTIHTVTMVDQEGIEYGITNVKESDVSRIEYNAANKSLLLFLKTSTYNFKSEDVLRNYPKTNSKNETVGGQIYGQYMRANGKEEVDVIAVHKFDEVREIWKSWNPNGNVSVLEKMHMSIMQVIDDAKRRKQEEELENSSKIVAPDGSKIVAPDGTVPTK